MLYSYWFYFVTELSLLVFVVVSRYKRCLYLLFRFFLFRSLYLMQFGLAGVLMHFIVVRKLYLDFIQYCQYITTSYTISSSWSWTNIFNIILSMISIPTLWARGAQAARASHAHTRGWCACVGARGNGLGGRVRGLWHACIVLY